MLPGDEDAEYPSGVGKTCTRFTLCLSLVAFWTTAIGCGYPDYTGFDKPRGELDASAMDATQDATEDRSEAGDGDAADSGDADAADDVFDGSDDSLDAEAEAFLCTKNDDCASDPGGPLCDTATGRCGACNPAQDVCPVGEYCSQLTLRCEVGCKADTDCVATGPNAADGGGKGDGGAADLDADAAAQDAAEEDVFAPDGEADAIAEGGAGDAAVLSCDPELHRCTGCAVDDDCPAGTICEATVCVPGCSAVHGCPAGRDCCTGACMDTSSDPLHCGNCTTACVDAPNAQVACASKTCALTHCLGSFADCDDVYANGCETDLAASATSCGVCGVPCVLPHSTPLCEVGACVVGTCDLGFADCDGDPSNGCEIDTVTDEAHCGTCTDVCGTLAHATTKCLGSSCEIASCEDGYADCNTTASDGCETTISANVNACGGCGIVCSLQHAVPGCVAGACGVASCTTSYANCDTLPGNGCEVDTGSDASNCGSCGKECKYTNASGVCSGGACQLGGCSAGFGNCNTLASDGCEANLGFNVASCGACGKACSAPHATPTCNGASCEIASCAAPFGDCNATYTDGCEVNLATTALNCGVCGKVCSFANAAASCVGGTCVMGACETGFANCDGDQATGCETDTRTTIQNCGVCGLACNGTHGIPSCSGGTCAISCNPGVDDCNHSASDGCETSLTDNLNSCGQCGTVCSASHGVPACNGAVCAVASCTGLWGDCNGTVADGCEMQLNSLQNCGVCGAPCALDNATASCATGSCALVQCDPGFANCDGNAANGCEVNLNADVNHCGVCLNACPSSGCTPKCTASVCGCSSCPVSGTADCDNNPGNGCETTLATDANHCGGCGAKCTVPNGTPSCVGSQCTVAGCTPGYGDCNSSVTDGCEAPLRTLQNCGACGQPCALGNATSSCATGACVITVCNVGFADCDGLPSNGCETNTASSPSACGACGHACSNVNGTPSCASGVCSIACATDFANCDGDVANGCETNVATTPASCGACGAACDGTNGTPTCAGRICGIVCVAGWGNCDSNAANGCETPLTTTSHCGTCAISCTSANGTAACVAGSCQMTCNTGFGNCDGNDLNGCEANLQTDPLNCTACGLSCNLAHATQACSGGMCAIGICSPGWTDCDGAASNGCETNTASGATNCGACGNVCTGANATPTCASGVCGVSCNTGWKNCDGAVANGCEMSTSTNILNCGSCGNVCPAIANGTPGCASGVCGVASCNAGFHPNGGVCDANVELCANGIDDDGDGKIDCFDTDCLASTDCNGVCMNAASIGCDTVLTGQNTGASGATQRIAPPSYSCTATAFGGPEYAYKYTGGASKDVFVEAYGASGDVGVMLVDVLTGAQCNAKASCTTAGAAYTSAEAEALGFKPVVGA